MKVGVVGSRSICLKNIEKYIPSECDEIVSGGAIGVDNNAAEYAKTHGLPLTVFLPEYRQYGRGAPIVRNKSIVDRADRVIAFWDGCSRGTRFVIDYCKKTGKHCVVIKPTKDDVNNKQN